VTAARYLAAEHRRWKRGWAASRLADAQWQRPTRSELSWAAYFIGVKHWAMRDRLMRRAKTVEGGQK